MKSKTRLEERPSFPDRIMGNSDENADGSLRHEHIWKLMQHYLPAERGSVQTSFVNHLEYTIARSRFTFDSYSSYLAVSYSVRDRLIELFNDTMEHFIKSKVKQVYYVSMEFLLGRFLRNALLNLELEDLYSDSLQELGVSIDEIYQEEIDPGLGRGGLGRLSSCFLDSLATQNYPAWGYGLLYSFGMFRQIISENGEQVEVPEYWMQYGNPWKVQKSTIKYPVGFYGSIQNKIWKPSLTIYAIANDFYIPGYATDNTLALRLWSSQPTSELDEEKFKGGDYWEAIRMKQKCEELTSVLYPQLNKAEGIELRFMQEYFLAAATLQDIMRRLKTQQKVSVTELPSMAAIQLNDTHPSIMIPELIRILIDEEGMEFEQAFEVCTRTFSFTCHTKNLEILEKWDVPLISSMLPRHMEIIYLINQQFLDEALNIYQCAPYSLKDLSIIEETYPKKVRMANLALIGCHAINGVSIQHTESLKESLFKHFSRLIPDRFHNKTNGVSIRRWLTHCNVELSKLITKALNTNIWPIETEKLENIMSRIDDLSFRKQWSVIKTNNKIVLSQYIKRTLGIELDPYNQMFIINATSIEFYKRQILSLLAVIYRFIQIKDGQKFITPRAYIYSGKSSPNGNEKLIIRLIHGMMKVINHHPQIANQMNIVFLSNYSVTLAEIVIPSSDISEHLSLPGTEASGTSNMKFAFNGGLLVSSREGSSLEISEHIGEDNVFFFGLTKDSIDVGKLHSKPSSSRLLKAIDTIRSGLFGNGFEPLINSVINNEFYRINDDFDEFLDLHEKIDTIYADSDEWTKMSIASVSQMSYFASDRAVSEYADQVWGVCECPLPRVTQMEPILLQKPAVKSIRRHHTSSSFEDNGWNSEN